MFGIHTFINIAFAQELNPADDSLRLKPDNPLQNDSYDVQVIDFSKLGQKNINTTSFSSTTTTQTTATQTEAAQEQDYYYNEESGNSILEEITINIKSYSKHVCDKINIEFNMNTLLIFLGIAAIVIFTIAVVSKRNSKITQIFNFSKNSTEPIVNSTKPIVNSTESIVSSKNYSV